MPTSLWCTGPGHVFIAKMIAGGNSGFAPTSTSYLGTCEYKPVITITTAYETATSNTRGPKLADDWLLGGETAVLRFDLTKWDEAVYASIANKGTKTRGTMPQTDIGAMVRREKLTFSTIVLFPFAAFFPGMPNGYRFPICTLWDELLDPLGTQARKLGLVIHAIPDDSSGNLLLYDDAIVVGALLPLTK